MVFIYDFFIIYKRYFGIQKYTNFNELFLRRILITFIKESHPNPRDFTEFFSLFFH